VKFTALAQGAINGLGAGVALSAMLAKGVSCSQIQAQQFCGNQPLLKQ
jgi:hypothetical protein